MKKFSILILVVLFFASCEEKMVVIPEFTQIISDKVVYVEELTGVRCPNCPTGSARLESIVSLYPDNVILVGIHGTDLTKPLDESKYDFRNDDAIELENYLKDFLGKPSAYFNRVKFPELNGDFGNPFSGQWQGYVERELEKESVINLSLSKSYDSETRQLNATVTALPLQDLDGEFKLTLLLTESGIVDAQDNIGTIELEYVHKHVLMDVVTAFNGDFLANDLKENTPISKTYTYTLPDNVDGGLWQEERIEVVAFVAYTTGESEEVLQATGVHLVD